MLIWTPVTEFISSIYQPRQIPRGRREKYSNPFNLFIVRIESFDSRIDPYPKNRMKLAEQNKKIVQASNIFQYEPPLDETHHQEDDKNSKKKRVVYHR